MIDWTTIILAVISALVSIFSAYFAYKAGKKAEIATKAASSADVYVRSLDWRTYVLAKRVTEAEKALTDRANREGI
jgi:hypothetical protein